MNKQVRVKICGVTNLEDALVATELGADAVGFVFYEKSPRYINPRTAALIIRELPPFVATVGVFVNEPPDKLVDTAKQSGVGCVQLHGDETPEYCQSLGLRTIKALRVKDAYVLNELRSFTVSGILLDTYREGVPGGTGETFDWEIAAEAAKAGRIILSGGLTPENVRQAIEKVRPYAVDVSSGVESKPGKKDHEKLRKFFEQVRTR
mgnify:FL=1